MEVKNEQPHARLQADAQSLQFCRVYPECHYESVSLFFIPLSSLYGITYTQIGFLVFVNFAAQFAADLFSGSRSTNTAIARFA